MLLCAAAYAEACSLFIPFDDYAGSVAPHEAGSADGTGGHGGGLADGGDDLDGDADADVPLVCIGVDVKSDPGNCGVCGRRCAGDAGCEGGRCPVELVVDNPGGGATAIRGLATGPFVEDAAAPGYVYYTRANGTLGRTSGLGEPFDTSATDAAVGAVSVAVGGSLGAFASQGSVSWFHENSFEAGAPAVVSPSIAPGPMSLQGSILYWGDSQGLWYKDIKVATARLGPLETSVPVDIEGFAGILYWTTADGTVFRMDTRSPGFPSTMLAGALGGVESIAVGKKTVILGQTSLGLNVYTIDPTLHLVLAKVIGNVPNPVALTADPTQTYVYVVDTGFGAGKSRLLRLAADGTQMFLIADSFTGAAHALAVADDWVYYADGPRILRTSR